MNDHRLNRYRESLKSAWGNNDYNDWPIKFNSIMHLFVEQFTQEYLADFQLIQQRGIANITIGNAFGNPSRIYRTIHTLILGMKKLRLDIIEQRKMVLMLLDLVRDMKSGSEFNEDGKNIIYETGQIAFDLQQKKLHIPQNNESALLQRFCGTLWAYTEALYFRAYDIPRELHGPYIVPGLVENLYIRDYILLVADEIWGQMEFIPYGKIRIYTEYSSMFQIYLDSFNHLSYKSGNYVTDLVSYRIETDGREISLDQAMALVPMMLKTIETVHHWVEQADWKTITNRYADIYWYRKRPLCNLLNRDWRVPPSVREHIQNGAVNQERNRNLTKEEIERLTQLTI